MLSSKSDQLACVIAFVDTARTVPPDSSSDRGVCRCSLQPYPWPNRTRRRGPDRYDSQSTRERCVRTRLFPATLPLVRYLRVSCRLMRIVLDLLSMEVLRVLRGFILRTGVLQACVDLVQYAVDGEVLIAQYRPLSRFLPRGSEEDSRNPFTGRLVAVFRVRRRGPGLLGDLWPHDHP